MPDTQQPSPFAVIHAGEDHPVQLLDGSAHLVRVRALRVRHFPRLLRVADNEPALLEQVCLLTAPDGTLTPATTEFIDSLDDDSHERLYEAAKRLNFSRLAKWAERHLADRQFVAEIGLKADEILAPLMTRLVDSLASLQRPSSTPAPATTTKS